MKHFTRRNADLWLEEGLDSTGYWIIGPDQVLIMNDYACNQGADAFFSGEVEAIASWHETEELDLRVKKLTPRWQKMVARHAG